MSLVGVVGASLGSAAFFSVATALKHRSAGTVGRVRHFRAGELRDFAVSTLRHPLWLGGILADVGGLALQVLALHLGALTVVQPLLLSAVLFSLVVAHWIAGTRISRRELVLGAVLVVSVAGFLAVSGAASAEPGPTDRPSAAWASALSLAVVIGCVVAARRVTHRSVRLRLAPALLGIAVGTIYAGTAALIKACTKVAEHGLLALVASWQLYALVAAGALGLFLAQMAFQAGPLAASLPATATVDPLVSVLLGIFVFDEQLRQGAFPVLGSLLFLALTLSAVGLLSRVRGGVEEASRRRAPAPG